MFLKGCHHHGFTVSNVEHSLRFYRDVLGLKLVRSVVEDDLSGEFILRNYIANKISGVVAEIKISIKNP